MGSAFGHRTSIGRQFTHDSHYHASCCTAVMIVALSCVSCRGAVSVALGRSSRTFLFGAPAGRALLPSVGWLFLRAVMIYALCRYAPLHISRQHPLTPTTTGCATRPTSVVGSARHAQGARNPTQPTAQLYSLLILLATARNGLHGFLFVLLFG